MQGGSLSLDRKPEAGIAQVGLVQIENFLDQRWRRDATVVFDGAADPDRFVAALDGIDIGLVTWQAYQQEPRGEQADGQARQYQPQHASVHARRISRLDECAVVSVATSRRGPV
ncbi:MAG: hypothetical protein ACC726_13810 [Chloroflexota bacterium]